MRETDRSTPPQYLSMYEIGIETPNPKESGWRTRGTRGSGKGQKVSESPIVMNPGEISVAALKEAICSESPEARAYLEAAINLLDDHHETCSHVITNLTYRQQPMFVLSVTTTVTRENTTVAFNGRGELLPWPLQVVTKATTKQLATQQAYIGFMKALCIRRLRGPSPDESPPATFHLMFR